METETSWGSKKLAITLIALTLLTGVFVLTVWLPVLVGAYPTFVGGLIGIVSVYLTGNVANKWVIGKVNNGLTQIRGNLAQINETEETKEEKEKTNTEDEEGKSA